MVSSNGFILARRIANLMVGLRIRFTRLLYVILNASRAGVCALAILGLSSVGHAHAASDDLSGLVTPRLVLSHSRVAPGARIKIGVHYSIKPGWHIYWRHPGDSGLPTQLSVVSTTLHPAGALMWPTPITFEQPGDIVGYGYESAAFLWREMDLPQEASSERAFPVRVATSWLACSDVCVPGKSTLEGSISIGEVDELAPEVALFSEWESRLPLKLIAGASNQPITVTISGGMSRSANKGRFELGFVPVRGEIDEVLLGRERVMSVSNKYTQKHGNAFELRFDAALTPGKGLNSPTFPVLVRLKDADGRTQAYEVEVAAFAG